MVNVEVQVKKSDIKAAAKEEIFGCGGQSPLETALYRVFPKADYVSVYDGKVMVEFTGDYVEGEGFEPDTLIKLSLPKRAIQLNNALKLEPFSFALKLKATDAAILKPAKRFVVAA